MIHETEEKQGLSSDNNHGIQVLPKSNVRVLPFGVSLTASVLQGIDEPKPLPQSELVVGDAGIVGTVTVLRKSAMIWFGWGKLDRHSRGNMTRDPAAPATTTGSGVPSMGQMVVGMPRTQYLGAFSDDRESSCSQLIGGDSSEDQLVATNMASRLSQKLQYPIFVSCALSSTEESVDPSIFAGLDRATVAQRAAALAERTVGKLLMKEEQAK